MQVNRFMKIKNVNFKLQNLKFCKMSIGLSKETTSKYYDLDIGDSHWTDGGLLIP